MEGLACPAAVGRLMVWLMVVNCVCVVVVMVLVLVVMLLLLCTVRFFFFGSVDGLFCGGSCSSSTSRGSGTGISASSSCSCSNIRLTCGALQAGVETVGPAMWRKGMALDILRETPAAKALICS